MKIEMTNTTDEIWENLNEGNYQIALGYIRWLILIMFIIINKKAMRLMAQLIKFYKFYYLLYLNKRWLNSQ